MSMFIDVICNKKIKIIAHWDCDGVCSGAILYHYLQNHSKSISYKTLGEQFYIPKEEFTDEFDYFVCVDMQPDPKVVDNRIIYIDHHPCDFISNYIHYIHDVQAQSCSEMIWDILVKHGVIPDSLLPYFGLLSILGFISDGGNIKQVPESLQNFIPQSVSVFSYISLLNAPKRVNWNGDESLQALCEINNQIDLFNYNHPNLQKCQSYKNILQDYYQKEFQSTEIGLFDCIFITELYNIQGVLCAKYKGDKPIIVLNHRNNRCIGSLRVPDDSTFQAGDFLHKLQRVLPEFIGGGHMKAGGFSFPQKYEAKFIEELKTQFS